MGTEAAPCCSIGARPDAVTINDALRAGEGLGTVAKRHGLVRGTLGKHRAGCLGIVVGQSGRLGTGRRETEDTPATPSGDITGKSVSQISSHSRARVEPQGNPAATSSGDTPATPSATWQRPDAGPDDSWPLCPPNREARVLVVMDLMTSFRWTKGETGPVLAARWGLSPDTLKDIAAEASRRVKSSLDPEDVRAMLCAALGKGIEAALVHVPEDPRALGGLASLSKAYAEITGATASKKLELTGKDGAPLGLPSTFAALDPPPTMDELEHFATTGELPKRTGGLLN